MILPVEGQYLIRVVGSYYEFIVKDEMDEPWKSNVVLDYYFRV